VTKERVERIRTNRTEKEQEIHGLEEEIMKMKEGQRGNRQKIDGLQIEHGVAQRRERSL
jgi:hypothetical protein